MKITCRSCQKDYDTDRPGIPVCAQCCIDHNMTASLRLKAGAK